MDPKQFEDVVTVALLGGMPKELYDRIFKKLPDEEFVEMMLRAKEKQNGV